MDKQSSTILEGEASESDEEVTDYPSFIHNTMVAEFPTKASTEQPAQPLAERSSGVVISGEASESDEEPTEYTKAVGARDFPSLAASFPEPANLPGVAHESTASAQRSTKFRDEYKRPKFKSPFHKRLRENNFYLRCAVVENTLETYDNSSEKLKYCTPIFKRTFDSIKGTLHDYRVAIEGLSVLQLSVDSIVESTSFPKFKSFAKT